jgi:cell division protein ZipA
MWDLRWVLLGLGLVAVTGIYLWSRGLLSRPKLPTSRESEARHEPSIGGESDQLAITASTEPPLVEAVPETDRSHAAPDRIVALRLIPRGEEELAAERAVAALAAAGMEHGRYSIFHKPVGENREGFSVASLTEPGTFDLDGLGDSTVAGLSFFLVLPGEGDPVARFDAMVETARVLSVELAADLFDERGSSWSSQRERYLREEIIEYRHQFERR